MTDDDARFRELTRSLAEQFVRFRDDPTSPYTAVVVPSQSVDPVELAKIEGVAHYEERSLFNLMLLRHPRLVVVYVTSKRLNPLIVDYYLHQMRGVPGAHARRRLVQIDCDDASARPLTQKILERPRVVERIKKAIGDTSMAHLSVFNATDLERRLALELGIPLNACDPALHHFGTKTGSREAFRAAGVAMPPGREGLRSVDALAGALAELAGEHPDARRAVVKLDDSFSGEGNAVIELEEIRAGGAAKAEELLPGMRFEAAGQTWEGYREQLESMGGICELWVEGDDKRSPSVQMRINPLGEVVVVSTHDQVLGGPSGQVFMGCTFPADERYRLALQELGAKVGEVLSERGVIGRFAVDFIASGDELLALEINLRSGGTTHPFNTLKLLTGGTYDESRGVFLTAQGRERAYFATDYLASPRYRGILPTDLLDQLVLDGVHFGNDEKGVLFHLLGCLSEYGKVGCTCIAEDVPAARALYERAVAALDAAAG